MKQLLSKHTILLAAFLLSSSATCLCQCPSSTTKGNDFWVTFLYNYHSTPSYNPGQLSLICFSDTNNTNVQVHNNTSGTTNLNLNSSNNRHIKHTVASNNEVIAVPYNGGYHVTSDHEIWLYAQNYIYSTQDVAVIFPSSALDTSYIAQDYPATTLGAQVAFVATEDNTVLTMTVPCNIYGTSITAGTTLTPTLMQGQSYLLISNGANSSFSGMTVTSNGKPFAMFQGGRAISVPRNATGSDLIYEQGVSTKYWGTEFVVKGASAQSGNNEVRITSLENGCTITIDGNTVHTLNAGQTYEYPMPAISTKHINTSKPAFVTLYLRSYSNNCGDPSSITIPPVDMGVCEKYFELPVEVGGVNPNHYIVVICDTSHDSGLRLDGNTLPTTGVSTVDGYRVHHFSSTQGIHHLQNTQGPFISYAYGVSDWESYGFLLGMKLEPPALPVYDTVMIHDTTCVGTAYSGHGFSLSATANITTGNITLYRQETSGNIHTTYILHLRVLPTIQSYVYDSIAYRDTLHWNGLDLSTAGDYTLTLTAQNGCDSTVTLHLTIYGYDTVSYYDTICAGNDYNGYGFSLNNARSNTILSRTAMVGDVPTLYLLHLTVLPVFISEVSLTIIYGDTLSTNDTLITSAGNYTFRHTASNGCDSIITLHISLADITINASTDGICPGDEVILTATSNSFIWTATPPDPELDSQQGVNPVIVHPTVSTTYHLLDHSGNILASVTINTDNAPKPCVELSRSFIDFDHPVVTFEDCSEGRHHSTWVFSDGITLYEKHVMRRFDPFPTDSIQVTLNSCNRYSCCSDTTFTLPCRIRSLWFPNAFTPDAETNNSFRPFTSRNIIEFEIDIYNRWGLHIWNSSDPEQGWDGRSDDGTPCPQDAYVYKYFWRDADGDFKNGVGTVTLLR